MNALCARDVMQRKVIVVREDAPLAQCVRLLCEKHITGLPVVDAAGSLVGIVSQTDLLRQERSVYDERADWRAALESARVRDVMSREVICASEDASVDSLTEAMLGRGIHRVVIASGRVVVGIVTTVDLAAVVARQMKAVKSAAERRRDYSNLYSNKHERLLMRVEHIDRIKVLQKLDSALRLHESQASLTVSDVVNACLDFVLDHDLDLHGAAGSADLRDAIARHVYRRFIGVARPPVAPSAAAEGGRPAVGGWLEGARA